MALSTPLRSFRHTTFYSMNNRDDGQVIPDLYATNIENWIIRNVGQLEMRDGLAPRGASPSATNLGSAVLYQAGQSPLMVRVLDGAANSSKFQQSTDGTNWTDISGGGSKATGLVWKFVQANNALYGVNGQDTAVKITVSGISTIAAIPLGTAIEWWKNRLWVFGVTSVPDRLYFSGANDPETFGGSDFINVNLGDNSPGVGLKGTSGSSGRLYAGKARSVWYVTGASSSDFAINPLTYEHGVASHESMVQVKNDVWCVDLEGNIRSLYRTQFDTPFSSLKSSAIQATIAGLNRVAIIKSSAAYFDNYALFFVSNGVDDYNSLVLVFDTLANNGKGGWMLFTNWRIARAVVFNEGRPKLWLFDARTGNGQAYQWSGTSDNGLAITAKYETKIYDHGFPEREKKWKFAYQFAPVIGSVDLKFYVSIDRFYYTLLKTFSLAGSASSLWDDALWDVDTWSSQGFVRQKINYTDGGGDNTGYTQQIKIEAESSTTKIKVREFTSHFRFRGLR